MPRKRWSPKTEITPEILKFREKRKWQISLRRYVLERNPCTFYAPYFGLDIENIRKWFEYQFSSSDTWESFAKTWQFDHIVPVTFFDFSDPSELSLCWNFTNLRVERFQRNKDRGNRLDVLASRSYFQELFDKTNYEPCLKMLNKIDTLSISEIISTSSQQNFILQNKDYLDSIKNYSSFEFELLNTGRGLSEVNKEINFLKKF
jgi:hypothetical protein